MKKSLLLLFVALATLLASAQTKVEIDGIWYNLNENTLQAEATYEGKNSWDYNGYSGSITISAIVTHKGVNYSVTGIGDYTFSNCSSLTNINIPESVTRIGDNAFYCCNNLTNITFPESVKSIGDYAFWDCSNLTNIKIPKGVTSIGNNAFNWCGNLTEIIVDDGNIVYDTREGCNAIIETNSNILIVGCSSTIIPESVTSIGDYAFSNCSSLITINIPEGVTSIGNCAFSSCSSLTSITIPEGVTSIAYQAFSHCSNLTDISLSEGTTSIGVSAFEGCSGLTTIAIPKSVTRIETSAFRWCSSLTAITIPEGVTSIGSYTFEGCSSLTTITTPESVTSIGDYAFYNCSSLTAITCNATTPPTVASSTFSGVDKSIPVYVPEGSVSAYKTASYWKAFTNILPLAEFTLTVSDAGYATLFLGYEVAIPDGVEVYIATSVEGDRLKMTQITDVLPAGTGVIVRAKSGTYTFTEIEGEYDAIEGNLLVGTTENTYITAAAGYNYYVLAQKDGVVGMYRPKLTNGQFLNNANKAYLALDMGNLGIFDDEVNTDDEGTQLSNRLRFDFGGTTGIEQTTDNSQQTTVIYDLQGRKVTDTEGLKGIYIIDGRKVIIK